MERGNGWAGSGEEGECGLYQAVEEMYDIVDGWEVILEGLVKDRGEGFGEFVGWVGWELLFFLRVGLMGSEVALQEALLGGGGQVLTVWRTTWSSSVAAVSREVASLWQFWG